MDVSKLISKSVSAVKTDFITSFSQQISDVPDLISLTIGEPDFNTPEHIKQAGIKAIENDETHYSNPQGILPLRQAATDFISKKYGIHYDPRTEALVTTGVNEAIFDTFKTLLDEGDEIIIPTPGFIYGGVAEVLGGKPVFVDTSADDFKLTPQRLQATLEKHPHAKGIVLNFPSNPTGRTYSVDELKALADVVKQHNILVISDEIYSELTYGQEHHSFAEFLYDQTIVFNGLSKSHAMTGWRIGVIFAPAAIIEEINKVHCFNTFNVPVMVQEAGVEAFKNGMDDALPMKKIYEERQKLVLDGLREAGIEAETPKGAFYIFAKVPASFNGDSLKFGLALANEAHVGIIPGVGFGPGGEGYFRISYATSNENLTEAVKRIKEFMKQH